MSLGVVLNEQQIMASADVAYAVSECASAVHVYNHDGTSAFGDGILDEAVVNLQRFTSRFHQYRLQSASRNGNDGGDVCVGRHNHLVALLQSAHLYVGTHDERKRVQTVAASHAMTGACIVGIFLLEAFGGVSLQKPSAVRHVSECLPDAFGMQGGDALKIDEFYHYFFSSSLFCIYLTKSSYSLM